jgi:4-oxalocrotonate tautomerase
MPIVRIEMLPGRSKEQKENLIKTMTDAMVSIAGTTADAVHVVIVETATEHWGIGGQSIAAKNK